MTLGLSRPKPHSARKRASDHQCISFASITSLRSNQNEAMHVTLARALEPYFDVEELTTAAAAVPRASKRQRPPGICVVSGVLLCA